MVTKQWDLDGGASIDVTFDHNYSDATPSQDPFTVGGEEYSFSNLRMGYSPANGDWRVLLWSRNITDEVYYPMALLGGNGPFVRSYAMPRTVGVTLDIPFGN